MRYAWRSSAGVLAVLGLLLLASWSSPSAALAPATTAPNVGPPGAELSPRGTVSSVGSVQVSRALASLAGGTAEGAERPAGGVAPRTSVISWQNITTTAGTAPSPRVGSAITYDVADGYVLLFGGENGAGTQLYSDTWKFQGGVWTNITTSVGTPPSPRVSAAMAYDVADGYVVLFGGLSVDGGSYLLDNSDTWQFHSGTWTNITTSVGTHPAGRFSPGLTYDWSSRTVVLFGGESALDGLLNAGITMYSDTWTFSGGKWTQITSTAGTPPSARSGVQMVYDPVASELVLYGGIWNTLSGTTITGYVTADTWTFAGGKWNNITATVVGAPGDRALAGFAFDPLSNDLVMVGGCYAYVNEVCPLENTTWTYQSGTWTDVTGTMAIQPPARGTMAMTNDSADGYLLFFGGSCGSGCAQQDTWREPAASSTLETVTFLSAPTACGPITVGGLSLASGSSQAFPTGHQPLSVGACAGHDFNAWNVTGSVGVLAPTSTSTTLSITGTGSGSVTAWFSPPLTVTASSNTSVVGLGGSVTLTASAWGGRAPYAVQWAENGTNLTGSVGSQNPATVSFEHASTYTFLAWVTDSTPSTSKSASFTVQVLGYTPPPLTANLSLSEYYAVTGTTIRMSAVSTGGTGLTYQWTENATTTLACSTSSCSAQLLFGGRYTFEVQVVDSLGRSATSSSGVTIYYYHASGPPPPTLAITLTATPSSTTVGSPILFNSTVSGGTPPYSIVLWTNVSGFSSPLGGWHTTFVPTRAGTFYASMWVYDHAGDSANSTAVTVTVTAPPCSTCGGNSSGLPISPLLLGLIVVVVVAAVALLWVVRHRRSKPGAPEGEASVAPGPPTAPPGYPAAYPPSAPPPVYAPGYSDERAPDPMGGYRPR